MALAGHHFADTSLIDVQGCGNLVLVKPNDFYQVFDF